MKKRILLVVSVLGMTLFTNCEPNNLAEDEFEIEQLESTDKKDSINSNGGPDDPGSNEEE